MSKVMIILSIFFAVFFIGFVWLFSDLVETPKEIPFDNSMCGDGSLEGKCSINKPYFCSNGTLIARAEVCGCPANTTKSKDSCISEFQTNSKSIQLKYILRGNEYTFNYTAYEGMVEHLSELPIYLKSNGNQTPSRVDFKLKNINQEDQRFLLMPLVVEIQNQAKDKEDQARIAISLVQNIKWGKSNKTTRFGGTVLDYSRYPYEVLYDSEGVCGEKSELLAFLLREIDYGVVFFYNQEENHEAIGIKCPMEESWKNSGYCFVETTGPSIITDTEINYVGGLKLESEPQILFISDGESLSSDIYEYEDAENLIDIRETINGDSFFFNPKKLVDFKRLENKYGLVKEYEAG
ncbi:hypothetical protein HYT25_04370 [Candidatus Pacearchaeota archaeon]|nr:hypothetical protein [Candidatus Pacearchaeota archaeon]